MRWKCTVVHAGARRMTSGSVVGLPGGRRKAKRVLDTTDVAWLLWKGTRQRATRRLPYPFLCNRTALLLSCRRTAEFSPPPVGLPYREKEYAVPGWRDQKHLPKALGVL